MEFVYRVCSESCVRRVSGCARYKDKQRKKRSIISISYDVVNGSVLLNVEIHIGES